MDLSKKLLILLIAALFVLFGCTSTINTANITVGEPTNITCTTDKVEFTLPVDVIPCSGTGRAGECTNSISYFAKVDGQKIGTTTDYTGQKGQTSRITATVNITLPKDNSNHIIDVCATQTIPFTTPAENQYNCTPKTINASIAESCQ